MDDTAFQELVERGIATLRPEIRSKLDNVAIVVADEPSSEQRVNLGLARHERLFGLYEGVPQSERGVVDEVLLPDKITIFKNAILETYSDQDDVAACIENTVWHEVAHHFGWDEAWVAREEERRGKQK